MRSSARCAACGVAAPQRRNRNQAAIVSWPGCGTRKRSAAPQLPDDQRRENYSDRTPGWRRRRPLSRRDIPLREKTLLRMRQHL